MSPYLIFSIICIRGVWVCVCVWGGVCGCVCMWVCGVWGGVWMVYACVGYVVGYDGLGL